MHSWCLQIIREEIISASDTRATQCYASKRVAGDDQQRKQEQQPTAVRKRNNTHRNGIKKGMPHTAVGNEKSSTL